MMKLTKTRELLKDKFLECLNEEKIIWERGWNLVKCHNAVSNYTYRGINQFILQIMAQINDYHDPRWVTFKQVKDNGWKLNDAKGKGIPVEFWQMYDVIEKKAVSQQEAAEIRENDTEHPDRIKVINKTYYVFNASLVEGIPPYSVERLWDYSDKYTVARTVLNNYLNSEKISVSYHGNNAYYNCLNDEITLPMSQQFNTEEDYMATLAHEIAHSTGHAKRLNRNLEGVFGSVNYAKEELRAEIASSFIVSELGIENNIRNCKAYIQSWIQIIEDKPNELFKAIHDAEMATDYVFEKGDLEFILNNLTENSNDLESINEMELV